MARRPPLGGMSDSGLVTLLVICAAAAIFMLVVQSNLEHAQRHEAFLAACARAGHDAGRCDFYWRTLAARALSNDAALSLISGTTK